MKRNGWLRVAVAMGIALWTLCIWWQSLLPAEKSAANSEAVMQLLDPTAEDTAEQTLAARTEGHQRVYSLRKVAHFAEFAVLGGLWGWLALLWKRRFLGLGGLLTGVVDECLQFFAPGRAPMGKDVLIDMGGYLCGLALVWVIFLLLRKKKQN